MAELRRDPVSGRWVIFAVERAERPEEFRSEGFSRAGGACPFCRGSEHLTPSEIFALRDNGVWRVRVVPNKFPALRVEGDLDKRAEGAYDVMSGIGAHEVIIESPEHVVNLTALDDARVGEVLWVYKQRLLDLRRDTRLVYGLVFKNVGPRAGATVEHSHSQLIALPVVPVRVQDEIERARAYFDFRGRCLFCDIVRQEEASQLRIVTETSNFVALEPFAARSPFETHVIPKRHLSHFEATGDDLLREMGTVLRSTLARLDQAIGSAPYNYLIHTAPFTSPVMEHYHWHLEIIPRITRMAGFEWGAGFFINPVPPENAAQYLREIREGNRGPREDPNLNARGR
ncbi:MAG: galactose-1-phosphate uridylyltransferase [Planctomycetes bacterium]|nr:galactose-1-phosphate uridylyltransferase [Planctomycetota bacterium]